MTSDAPGTSTPKTGLSRALAIAREHPQDAVSAVVLLCVAVVSALDLFNVIVITTEAFSSGAIAVGSVFALIYVSQQRNRRRTDEALTQIRTQITRFADAHETRATVLEVESSRVGPRLHELLADSESWHFRGGSGRWQRSTVLPELSSRKSAETAYWMQIVDPTNEALCARYAQYRSQQRSAAVLRPDEGSPEVMRDDLLACLYAAGWYGACSRVKPKVLLSQLYSPLRVDVGSKGLMVSVADPTASGVFAPKGSWYYDSIMDEFRRAADELPHVELPAPGNDLYPSDWRQVDSRHVEAFIQRARVRNAGGGARPRALDLWGSVDYGRIAKLAFLGRGA